MTVGSMFYIISLTDDFIKRMAISLPNSFWNGEVFISDYTKAKRFKTPLEADVEMVKKASIELMYLYNSKTKLLFVDKALEVIRVVSYSND